MFLKKVCVYDIWWCMYVYVMHMICLTSICMILYMVCILYVWYVYDVSMIWVYVYNTYDYLYLLDVLIWFACICVCTCVLWGVSVPWCTFGNSQRISLDVESIFHLYETRCLIHKWIFSFPSCQRSMGITLSDCALIWRSELRSLCCVISALPTEPSSKPHSCSRLFILLKN